MSRAGKKKGLSAQARQSLRERRRFKRRAGGLGDWYRRLAKEHGASVRDCMATGFYLELQDDAGIEVIRRLAREAGVRASDAVQFVRNRSVPESIVRALAPVPVPSGERRAQFLGQQP